MTTEETTGDVLDVDRLQGAIGEVLQGAAIELGEEVVLQGTLSTEYFQGLQ